MWIFWLLLLAPCSVYAFGFGGQGCDSQLLMGFLLGKTLDGFGGSLFGSTPKCPEGFQNLDGCPRDDCYFFSTDTRSWDNARIDCNIRGAHLVIVRDSRENDAIKKKLMTINPAARHWMALNDRHTEGTFRWDLKATALKSSDFTDFNANFGDNTLLKDCVAFDPATFKWSTLLCVPGQRYICKRRATRRFSCNLAH